VILAPVAFGAVFLDCLIPLSPAHLVGLRGFVFPGTRTGVTGFFRYAENLTAAELTSIVASGYQLIPVGESRPNGYVPTAADGSADAARVVAIIRALGIPAGVTVGCDLEGMGGGAQDTIEYANAQAAIIQSAGDGPMAYVGAGVPLTSAQLYQLKDTLYWHSLSSVQPVAVCDYAVLQGFPTQTLRLSNGILLEADVNFIYRDKEGRGPVAVSQ
jgi:hypothetical protein